MISRRNFFSKAARGLGLSLLAPSFQTCTTRSNFRGAIQGPNAALGHRLRSMDFESPTKLITTGIVIVGGGVAGLSAARYLKKHTDDFLLIELEQAAGGNSIAGANAVSAFPWGAHYLPLPGNSDPELIKFLQDRNVITEMKEGMPVYNEYYLCHDPKERLYINHFWQDSIIPHEGVPQADRDQIRNFIILMNDYKTMTGSDGKPAFAIPLELSSQDESIIRLDRLTAERFLSDNGFASPFLRWYVNYCCADDYGCSLQQTSAWAMIHYFASRRGVSYNAPSDAVLTWPEGNFWLVRQLQKSLDSKILTNTLAYSVNVVKDKVEVLAFDANNETSTRIVADKVIMATPQFVNKYLLKGTERKLDYGSFQYSPWMVANITVSSSLDEGRGEKLCWDNVIYGSDSLGYVNAMHQQLGIPGDEKVITYYRPLTDSDPVTARMNAYSRSYADWESIILRDLSVPHHEIKKHIREMNIWIWGHGMIRPSPGFIWRSDRTNAQESIDKKIFFAHSDVGGISIFEEAFYQGHKSAKAALSV